MSNSQIPGERVRNLADQFLAVPTSPKEQRSLNAALFMFLDTRTKTALHRAGLVSKSALSRLLHQYDWKTAACWTLLQTAQWEFPRLVAFRKRRPVLRLSVDLTSIEKKGSTLPNAACLQRGPRHPSGRPLRRVWQGQVPRRLPG